MRTVGSRELKNRLGKYLALVGKGETLVVTDRGRPVARLAPANTAENPDQGTEQILKRLEAEGHLRRGSGIFRPFTPIRKKGKPASKIILEERD
jgi:prevent-host-death family protein